MKLEVGEYYLNAKGEIIKIDDKVNVSSMYPFRSYCSYSFKEDGKYSENATELDLIAHIPKELHFDIIRTIKAYHTDNTIKEYIDNAHN